MSGHTSWTYGYSNDTGPNDDLFVEFFEILSGDDVAGMFYSENDARLACAARELLEACELHINTLRSQIRNGVTTKEYSDSLYEAESKMIAAIAKARGKS